MDASPGKFGRITSLARRMLHRFLAIGENRIELFLLEVQEEREKLVKVLLLVVGMAVFGLLAGIALTLAVMLFFWERSPVLALVIMTLIYGLMAAYLYHRMMALQRDWQTLPGTLEQLRKDRECLDQNLL
ncbi:MAG TPA: phage holin family protein [Verrucomicrobiae bacterium]